MEFVGVFVTLLVTGAMMVVCRRAGYSAWWGLLTLVPVVNVFMLCVLAVRPWPLERELAQLRLGIKSPVRHVPGFPVVSEGSTGEGAGAGEAGAGGTLLTDAATVFAEASRLERQGEWEMAIALYEQLAARLGESQDGEYAVNCVKRLRERMGQQPPT
jgi:hypothetical protein